MQSFEKNCAYLLLDVGFGLDKQSEQNKAKEECVTVRVAELIHDAIQETQPGLFIELDSDFFKQFNVLLFFLLALRSAILALVASFLGDEKNHCVYD